jgi:L,D-peptidoglycan transpeptidase YkuD (ErfK/YbiS/YcfS/YnhG family)
MIIVKKSGYLKYKNFKFRCALGKNGIGKKIKEGDNITPMGTFKITKIYYRPDKIKKLITFFKKIKIKRNIGWCDDPRSKFYNKQMKIPSKFSHERLYRTDNIYDIIAVLNYNINPTIKNKGSAIFIHIAKNNYKLTAGCVAIKKNNLIKLLKIIKKNTRVKISTD